MLLSIALLVLGHVLLGTLYRWLGQSRRWRFGWTFSMYATLWILFVIAVGTAGLFDHVVWLLND
ncbi:MAG TPA: hypothetical protein VFC07_15430, partial [Verrucomicrobiae bacterium]|nr:hypothetical protein [Verrucomicrobiae bacterium]